MFKWTEALRKNLVETCLEAHAGENFTDSGFKSAEWSGIEERFNAIAGEINANKQQLQNQLAEIKGHHTMYGYIVNQLSGFGIDPDTGLPAASDKCWEEFIKAHAKAGRFETKPFPLFKDLQTLFAGKGSYWTICDSGATKRNIEDRTSVDDSSDDSFCEFMGNIIIVKEGNVNKDSPLTAVKYRDRQPLLKKSPTALPANNVCKSLKRGKGFVSKRPALAWALINSSQHLSEAAGRPVSGSIPNPLSWFTMYPYQIRTWIAL